MVVLESLYRIFLDCCGFFFDTLICVGKFLLVETFPFVVAELVVVQLFELFAKVCYQVCIGLDSKILVALCL